MGHNIDIIICFSGDNAWAPPTQIDSKGEEEEVVIVDHNTGKRTVIFTGAKYERKKWLAKLSVRDESIKGDNDGT